ncbi:MAG: hypothetical protein FJX80_02800 [Bacteroidetes bacterium]|nr:hypothetical protein [Bacteroidota bacterium]
MYYLKDFKHFETLVYSAFISLLSVVQTVLMTKFLVQKDYGYYGFYISLSQIVLILANWGFSSWAVNELSRKSKLFIGSILNKIILAKMAIGGITIMVLLTYIFIGSGRIDSVLTIAFLIYYLSIVFSLEVLYVSLDNINNLIKISLISKLIFTLIYGLILFFFQLSVSWLFLLFSLQSLTISFFLYLNQNDFRLDFSVFRSRPTGVILKSGPNFLLVFSSFLFASGPVIMAGHFLSKDSFAIVYSSTAVVKMLQASYQPLINKILPKLNLGVSIGLDVKMAFLFGLVSTVFLYFFAPFIVEIIFSRNYTGLVQAIRLFSLSLVPGILSTIVVSQWAVYANNLREMYVIVALIALINFLVVILFSSQLTWQFILIIMLLSELVLLFSVLITKRRELRSIFYAS